MHVARRNLFDSPLVSVGHVSARPSAEQIGEVERQSANVVVLPLSGLFAKHDGSRRQIVATPNHALLIATDVPYRISLPGGVGDECLALRFSPSALSKVAPRAMRGDRFDPNAFATHALLSPELMLARSLLWRSCSTGDRDPLEVEELATRLLISTLNLARKTRDRKSACSSIQQRQILRVVEAVSANPSHRWTLGALAELASVSPWHLAHVFRAHLGLSVYRYVLRARLAAALPAVLETDQELAAIAADAGFANHSHFTARFRALFGTTPLALRRRARS